MAWSGAGAVGLRSRSARRTEVDKVLGSGPVGELCLPRMAKKLRTMMMHTAATAIRVLRDRITIARTAAYSLEQIGALVTGEGNDGLGTLSGPSPSYGVLAADDPEAIKRRLSALPILPHIFVIVRSAVRE